MVESACRAQRRCPKAMASKNTVLTVTSFRDASRRGSKGGLARAASTAGRLYDGRSFRTGSRFRKRAHTRRPRHGAVETPVPSENLVYVAAIAERYPRMVDTERPLSKREMRKSAMWFTGAERGSRGALALRARSQKPPRPWAAWRRPRCPRCFPLWE